MKKTALTIVTAGAMLLAACGTKPAETTVAPTTEATTTTTTAVTTAETTETTIAEPEIPVLPWLNGKDLVTNVQVTNITYRLVDGKEFYGDDPAFEGQMVPVYEAQANQDIVITFLSNESLVLNSIRNFKQKEVTDKCTFTNEGNTYTLTIPANTFPAGDTCFILITTNDYVEGADGKSVKGKVINTNFKII